MKKRKVTGDDIVDFLTEGEGNPTDKEFHEWAESKGFDVHEAEQIMYALATKHVKMGHVKKSRDDAHGFHVDMEKDTVENDHFRKVLFTGPNAQLVLMSLEPGEDIGLETHNELDQFIRADAGSGVAKIGGKMYALKDGSAIIVPAGAAHNITAGKEGLKLYAVYTKQNHPDDVIDETKKKAIARESVKKSLEGDMETRFALVVVPGEIEPLEKSGAVSHPAGLSNVNGKIKSKIPYEGHAERMKFAKMAAKRMIGSSTPEDEGDHANNPTVDTKGKEKGAKKPHTNYNSSASGMGSQAHANFNRRTIIVKPSEIGSSAPESASKHQPPKVRKPKK